MTTFDKESYREFLLESRENLDSFSDELLQLEKTPREPRNINGIFRVIHDRP